MSKIFKASRVVLDDKVFVLTHKSAELATQDIQEDFPIAGVEASAIGDQIIDKAHIEATRILEEADEEAQLIIEKAEKSRESIISDAYDQAKDIMSQARQDGYREGFESSVEQGQLKANQIINEAQDIKDQWLKERESIFNSVEKDIVALVLETLEKMLQHTIETDITLIETLIKQGIKRVNRTEVLSIRVSTEDYNHAVAIKPMILSMSDRVQDVDIKRDPLLRNGSCLIDTDSGSVDSGIWTQFEQVRAIFETLLNGECNDN